LPYLQDGPGILSIQVLEGTSKSTIETIDPIKLDKIGGKPLKGKFKIKCKNAKGEISITDPFVIWTSDLSIQNAIGYKCDGLRNKIRVTSDNLVYQSWSIGR
jgi:hypothetical protein